MRTPDLCFTSTGVPIGLLNRSATTHIKGGLLFSPTNTCSGGLHRWGGCRDWATYPHQFSRRIFKQGEMQTAVAQSIARAWLFLPAFHTCSRDAFLQGFWSGLPLAVPSNEWCSQRNIESLDVPLCCLHDRRLQHAICLHRVAWAEGTCCWVQAARMAILSSCLHFFHPCLAYTWTGCYSTRDAHSATSQLRPWTTNISSCTPGLAGPWELGGPDPDPDPANCSAAALQIPSWHFTEGSGKGFRKQSPSSQQLQGVWQQ